MYSIPVIVAPAAAVGTGSCQTRVRLRLVSGLDSANASAASTAVAPFPAPTGCRQASVALAAIRRVMQVGGDLRLADRDPRSLCPSLMPVS
jgi:hypothetical protein